MKQSRELSRQRSKPPEKQEKEKRPTDRQEKERRSMDRLKKERKSRENQEKERRSMDRLEKERKSTEKQEKERKVAERVDRKATENNKRGEKETRERKPTKFSNRKDVITMKDVLEKNRVAKVEDVYGKGSLKKKEAENKYKRSEEEKVQDKGSSRIRTRTRTLSPSEAVIVKPDRIGDRREQAEVGEGLGAVGRSEEGGEDDYADYEDDFEDYESDFEEPSSEDDEEEKEDDKGEEGDREDEESYEERKPERTSRKLSIIPSGGDIDVRYQSGPKNINKEMAAIKAAMVKEYDSLHEPRKKSAEEVLNSPGRRKDQVMTSFVNFSDVKKRQGEVKAAAKTKQRGEQLTSMITLDIVSYTLFELPPASYETYMKVYGRTNTTQAQSQTNEDALEEQCQTDHVEQINKWTQFPVEFVWLDKKNETFRTREQILGAGVDDRNPKIEHFEVNVNYSKLNKFLLSAGQTMLNTIEDSLGFNQVKSLASEHSKSMSTFSSGFVSLNVNSVSFLKGRPIAEIRFSTYNSSCLLSVHSTALLSSQNGNRFNAEVFIERCLACVWNLLEPSRPSKILVSSSEINTACFAADNASLVFAGMYDGSVCCWDLRESSSYHLSATAADNTQWNIRSPTYSTAEIIRDGHRGPVVSIRSLTKVRDVLGNEFAPTQACSLDESGQIIIWTVTQSVAQGSVSDPGLAPWGKIKLVKSSSISLLDQVLRNNYWSDKLTCNGLELDSTDETRVYVTTNTGNIVPVSTEDTAQRTRYYTTHSNDTVTETTCVEMCPFEPGYFLTGCVDGSIRLYSKQQDLPLIGLNGNISDQLSVSCVVCIKWMMTRPCVFFVLDKGSRIHIWNLSVSDMYPESTIQLDRYNIKTMDLIDEISNKEPCLVLGTADGKIELHYLTKEYGSRTSEQISKEKKMFLRYVSIL